MSDQSSLHDSLTDTHHHAKSSAYQYVAMPDEPRLPSQDAASAAGPSETISGENNGSIGENVSANTQPITAAETTDAFQQAEHGVEVGSGDSEQDDGYETDGSAASMSLASSARDFIFENGRRYHSFRAGAYSFPNDDREQDREDLKHAMFLKLFNKQLHFAPIPTSGSINVIDLGTGTGIWSIDCGCAQQFEMGAPS